MGHKITASLYTLALLSIFCETIRLITLCHGHLDDRNDQISCVDSERKALIEIKQGLTDPLGRLSSWVGNDCCKWRGIICDKTTGRVAEMKLRSPDSESSLGGEINPALRSLKDLSHLDLSMNNFGNVPIPSFIGSLESLSYLNLSGASFGGAIPPSLGKLNRLNYLDLKNVYFMSNQSELYWLSSLSSLKYLNLEGWDLSKASSYWLQTVNQIPSLSELRLHGCGLSNISLTLPFVNFSSLSVLDLSNNGFDTEIPNWLFGLKTLTHLNLNSNNFHGPLPEAFANLSSLKILDLSINNIEGQLSCSLGKLCDLQTLQLSANKLVGEITDFVDSLSSCSHNPLENLDLGFNGFTGNFPVSLGNLKRLKYLQISQNAIRGSIPDSIGNLSSLNELYLSSNQMSGDIPKSLGKLSALVVLEISQNKWEGAVTEEHLANLSSLKEVTIYNDWPNISLSFDISPNWVPPFRLTYIEIRSCELGPEFPLWLRNQSDLNTVVLNNAMISGPIPNWFLQMDLELDKLDVAYNQITSPVPNSMRLSESSTVDLSSNLFEGPLPLWSPNIIRLYLRDNQFSGSIPYNISKAMPNLTDLDISQNSLTGEVPSPIGNLTQLTTLVLSNNLLSGEIPSFWANTPLLYIVDMSNNSLSGTIPESLGSLTILRFLVLSKNSLSRELPSSLKNCTRMDSLDLGDNHFSGDLPSWIGESMSSLLILSLRNNRFTGSIPRQLCGLSNLHILDLSINDLSGQIPSCIGNLSGLKTELTDDDTTKYQGRLQLVAKGKVLEYASILYLVNSLDLSQNDISGEIPRELTSLVKLGTLNLSMNQLSGKIPVEIGNLERLETLDLSMNSLSGTIPQSMASLTFLNHLNLSDNDLSGKIPATNQFLALEDPAIYGGNAGLCGKPLEVVCGGEGGESSGGDGEGGGGGDLWDKVRFVMSVGVGFFVGFWGVCGSLLVKRSWRERYFEFVERVRNGVLEKFRAWFVKEKHPWEL